jgi:hypothetical protein
MRTVVLCLIAAVAAPGASIPQVEITNGSVKAQVYLPDAEAGYYRATRFDWAGVIGSVVYQGRQFFGEWFPKYDPKLHDSIVGPVDSFDPIGYNQAKPGGTFLRIGVGLLKRRDDKPMNQSTTFDIADGGKWTSTPGKDRVEITQDLRGVYLYRKTVSLANDKPMLILGHSLKNTGSRVLETNVYNHGFYMLGSLPSGPDVTVQFPFEPRATMDLKGLASLRGKQLIYNRELTGGDTIITDLLGFGQTSGDYDIRIENRRAKAGIRLTADAPMTKLRFWSIRTTVCPEPFIHIRVEPGKEIHWRVAFEFYTLDSPARARR